MGAQHPGHRVVLEREGPDALAPNAALDEGGPQRGGHLRIECILTVNGSLLKGHGGRVHIAVEVALAGHHVDLGEVDEFRLEDLKGGAHGRINHHGGVHLGQIRCPGAEQRGVLQDPGQDGDPVRRGHLIQNGVGEIESDDDALVVIGQQGRILGGPEGRGSHQEKQREQRLGVQCVHGFFLLQVNGPSVARGDHLPSI